MKRTAPFEALIEEAQGYLRDCQAALGTEYRLWDLPRYDWHQDTRQLIFSENGAANVIADIQFVGSISTESDTWLWAWANDSVAPQLSSSIRAVRDYGEKHGFDQLTSEKWHAHEVDGWEMTSISAFLLKARGAYRSPRDTGFTFMVITDIRWAA